MLANLLTAEEFQRLDGLPRGCRHELVDGQVISRPLRTWECGEITGNIAFAIKWHLMANPIGAVSIGTGVIVQRSPDTVRAPDVSFITQAGVPSDKNRYLDGAPDLCVEVLSEEDDLGAFETRRLEYMRSGARAIWLVQTADRSVTVYNKPEEGRLLHQGTAVDGGDVLPGFSCPVADFFQ